MGIEPQVKKYFGDLWGRHTQKKHFFVGVYPMWLPTGRIKSRDDAMCKKGMIIMPLQSK
jgi:hypothetical protein